MDAMNTLTTELLRQEPATARSVVIRMRGSVH
jgi:hypothetical protein